MGALTTTRKSTGYQLQFLSPHFFSGKLQRNIDKEILRIKLVLFRVPGGAQLITVGIDVCTCRGIGFTRVILIEVNVFCYRYGEHLSLGKTLRKCLSYFAIALPMHAFTAALLRKTGIVHSEV